MTAVAELVSLTMMLLLSNINSCQTSRVRGHTKVLEPTFVLEPEEDPKNQMKSKFVREILRFPALKRTIRRRRRTSEMTQCAN